MISSVIVALAVAAAAPSTPAGDGPAAATPAPDAADARRFLDRTDADFRELSLRFNTADWVASTFITHDTLRLRAWASESLMELLSRSVRESLRYRDVPLEAAERRQLDLLRLVNEPPAAPSDPRQRAELAQVAARLGGLYGEGKWCGKDGKGPCRDLDDLEAVMASSRDWDTLVDAWAGWRTVGRPMRPLYERLVALSNEGAREIGFPDVGAQWRSAYDMPPDAFAAEVERLWQELRPMYEQLHCHVRAQLQKRYGKDRVPDRGPIPAHLLGNMWAQSWENVYPLVEPYPGLAEVDVSAALKAQGWDAIRMVKTGEAFFVSLGLPPLPETFWSRSQLVRPRDREVVCHASAWNIDMRSDLRIKMCIRPTEEDLVTIHHELGHNYYQRAYEGLPALLQNGAHDGFHEAIGDALVLSVTPDYLTRLGLRPAPSSDPKSLVNTQMRKALEQVPILPFGLVVDRWRWDVFSGKVLPARYDASWWEMRARYQGITPPVPRSEADFDPGAKYHVAANVPYTRYVLAQVLQYQFHRAMCRIARKDGPIHECSIHGDREVGRRFGAMLAMGASRPWPDALEALTGERRMDAGAMLEYFAPLRAWLAEQNRGRACGW